MTKSTQANTFSFQAEVKSLLKLMIHSLYSNRDIFLRELISNASDACDKLRFLSVSDPHLLEGGSDLKITVDFDAKAKTLSVQDNGIGMTADEVIENLGTIAKSGTKAFLDALSKKEAQDSHLIGQFGVGFYSAFMVAEKVTVITRKAGLKSTDGVKWESIGEGEFKIEPTESAERGTQVILHLRQDADGYLNMWRLQEIIRQYSDHILVPILLREDDEKEVKFKQANSGAALWAGNKNEITPTEYQDFYRHISHDFHDALDWLHFQVEGKQQYTALLYLPKVRSQDMFMREQKHGLKLFIERVFIMDNADLLPNYLRFINGVVDSSDLPLNVSREILQTNPLSEKIKTGLVQKILQFLKKMAEKEASKYQEFWGQFGVILKEGLTEDFQHQKELAELCRFHSSLSQEITSLKEYVARMKPEQKEIYYIIAENRTTAENSPHLEIFKKKGIEVLLLIDRVDEWAMSYLKEYAEKKLLSIAKGDIDFAGSQEEKEAEVEQDKKFHSLIAQLQKILESQVKTVRLSKRLTDSPSCLIADEEGLSLHLQRMMESAGQTLPSSKPILEINAQHELIQKLLTLQAEDEIQTWAVFLFDQALLAEGGILSNPALFVKKMNHFILKN